MRYTEGHGEGKNGASRTALLEVNGGRSMLYNNRPARLNGGCRCASLWHSVYLVLSP